MAEEGTLGQARASHEIDDDGEPSKQELQRRMEEARETITQTVTEIKETVTNQYYSMKETVSDALDWRHHFRKNPIAFSIGALSVGALVGYGLAGALKGNGNDREGYPSSDESDVYARTNATPSRYEDSREEAARHSAFHGGSFAAQPITDGSHEASDYGRGSSAEAEDDDESNVVRISQGGSYSYSAPREEQREQTPEKPGLFERFKETPAYDRLQTEVATLGDRFIEQLSSTAQTVVLPALFNKIKELFGVDLSGKQGQQSQGDRQPQDAAPANTGAKAASASASNASASLASASRGSAASSYATSENRGYGAQGATGEADRGGEESSVLDLDR
ncbi:MAG: hypothetical protein QOH25_2911 [Acidobacteriota bacterium]|jgi:hypothetical protein|nr:hypothetical protein [Acidobacteriota bacterium]